MIPEGNPGAGGYREHDILVIGKDGAENITKFPFGPEHNIIKNGARIADIGGYEILKNIKEGATELEIAISGRDKMEREIAKTYPNAEYMDTWVWFQSGINTDGAHNPKTNRKLVNGDILSLNTFPMISGYYTALERTLFLLILFFKQYYVLAQMGTL